MPELPEVETMRRGIAAVLGRRITEVIRPPCKCRPIEVSPDWRKFRRQVTGRTIAALDRVGKRVVIRLDSGDAIVIEPRMTGLVLLADPPDREHLRWGLQLEALDGKDAHTSAEGLELLFWDRRGLGLVRLVNPAEFDRLYGPAKLGPDALQTTPQLLRERLGKSRRAIKVALLDQRALAGVGNLYASEILHLAGISPGRSCDRVKAGEWSKLHAALLEVLEQAILHEGSTLSDGTYRNALNEQGSYQNQHRVYDRADEVCARCPKGRIVRIVQAQRSTFYCPKCQK
jgi:formamidopyrimidine-DNA glycosylase